MNPKIRTLFFSVILSFFCLPLIAGTSTTARGYTPNLGQVRNQNNEINKSVLFQYSGNFLNIQLKKNAFSYEMYKRISAQTSHHPDSTKPSIELLSERVDIQFLNTNPDVRLIPKNQSSDYINFYNTGGQPVLNVFSYESVVYSNLYPGIDLEFILDQDGQAKFNFIIHPDGNPSDIKWTYGSERPAQLINNEILFSLETGELHENIPLSFLKEKPAHIIGVRYQNENGIYSFDVEVYESSKTLIIDPRPWVTYLGGIGEEFAYGVGHDKNEDILTAGETWSTYNIATSGTYLNKLVAGWDAFVVKYSASGGRIWGTYYGGESNEECLGFAVDSNGNACISGQTLSQFGIATNNSYQSYFYGGISDSYIAKFDSNGQLSWATYYGGNGQDKSYFLCLDDSLNIYVTGMTESTTNISTTGAFQPNFTYRTDGFIVKFNPAGSIQWATYIGGKGNETSRGITHNKGDSAIYVTGFTDSYENISTSGTHQYTKRPGSDGYIMKFDKGGQRIWGTYHGGNNTDYLYAICADLAGNIFVTGMTNSDLYFYTPGCYQSSKNSFNEMAISKFTSNGAICWATYYGGDGTEYGRNITVNLDGDLIITGYTTSSTNFCSQYAYRNTQQSSTDAFLLCFDTSDDRNWCTYVGGPGTEHGYGLSIGNSGQIYLSGFTTSNNSIVTPGAFQPSLLGGHDAFVSYYTYDGYPDRIDSNILFSRSSPCTDIGDSLYGFLPFSNWKDYHYQWISSFSDSAGTYMPVSLADTFPSIQLDTIKMPLYYRRIVYSGPMRDTSNAQVVYPSPKARIFTFSDTLCEGSEGEFRDSSNFYNLSLLKTNWRFDSSDYFNSHTLLPGSLVAGNHTLFMKVESPQGCLDSTQISLFVPTKPKALIQTPKYTLCEFESFTINNNSVVVDDSILTNYWNFGDGTVDSTQYHATHIYQNPGYYYPELIFKTKYNCSDTSKLFLIVNPTPDAKWTISNDSFCFGVPLLVQDSSSISDASFLNSYWHFGDNTIDSGKHLIKDYKMSGSYTLRHFVVSNNGCVDSLKKTIVVHPLPNRDSITGPLLRERPSTLTAYYVPQQLNTLYNWQLSNGNLSSGQNTDSIQVVWLSNGPADIRLKMTNQWGCIDSVYKYIQVSDTPFIISFYPTEGKSGDSISIFGFNFYSTFDLNFGGTKAASFSVISDNEIVAILDQGSSGIVKLQNLQGVAQKTGFNYLGTNGIELPEYNLKIYPNPVRDKLIIESEKWQENQPYKVFNAQGLLILQGQMNGISYQIDFSELASGLYTLMLGNESGKVVKIIKE